VECRICGKKFYPDKLRVHRKYFCGETAQRTEAQSKTQKKLPRVNQETKNNNLESSGSESSDDTITQQKKKIKIKLVKTEKKQEKGKKEKHSGKKSGKQEVKVKSEKKKNSEVYFEDEESSEDEITKQKKAIKKALEEHSKSPKAKTGNSSQKKKAVSTKRKKAAMSSDDEDEESEKELMKKRKISEKKAVPVKKLKKLSKTIIKKEKSLDDSDDSDFGEQSGSESEQSDVKPKKKSAKSPSKNSKKSLKNSPASKKKKQFDSESEFENNEESSAASEGEKSMELGSDDDYQVEKDIQEALLQHAKDMKKANAPKSILHMVSWFRIILDEAHLIKDRSTSTCKSVFNLVSIYKWCLTGTPLQNRVSELYSLIRFLRIDPHAYYFCRSKDCSCKSLHYRFSKSKCDDCGHSVISHFCYFNRNILNPIQRTGFVAEGRRAMLKLKQQILDEILLRRTKTTKADDIQLPMRIVKLRQEKLDEKEEDFYQALYTQSRAQFDTYLQSNTVLNNYAHIFDILIRLRQAVNHPYLVIYSETRPMVGDGFNNNSNNNNSLAVDWSKEYCNLCQEPLENNQPTPAQCGHIFCHSCIMDYIDTMNVENGTSITGTTPTKKKTMKTNSSTFSSPATPSASSGSLSSSANGATIKCPDCDQPLTLILDPTLALEMRNNGNRSNANLSHSVWDMNKKRRKSILDKINLDLFQTSTKMEALMQVRRRRTEFSY
jgi:DNA repair protein RAD16